MFSTARVRFVLVLAAVFCLGAVSAFAQTPVPPPTTTELVTGATGVFTDAGVTVVVFATAIISLGTMLYRKFRGASR